MGVFKRAISVSLVERDYKGHGSLGLVYMFENNVHATWYDKILYTNYDKRDDSVFMAFAWNLQYVGMRTEGGFEFYGIDSWW